MGRLLTADVRGREDLSAVIDTLMLGDDDMKMCAYVNKLGTIKEKFNQPVINQKHEWLDDEGRAITLSATAGGSGTDWDTVDAVADLPVATAEISKLRIGDQLLLPGGDEVVIVTVIDTAAQTIDVEARGHGGTSGTAQGTAAFTIKLLPNAQPEDSDPISANQQPPTEKYNYTQQMEDVASESGVLRRSKEVGGDTLDYNVVKKAKELLRSFNIGLVEGIKAKVGTRATMGGIREFLSTTSNVGGALTIAKFYTALVAHVDSGLFPHAIHANATVISKIEQLFNTTVRTKTSEKKGGQSINVIDAMGYEIELAVDRDSRDGEFLILDKNRIAYGPLAGGKYEDGSWASYPLYDKMNAKQIARQVFGEYTERVSNGGATRAYGIT